MKQFYILILLISSIFLNAQATGVVTGLNGPAGLQLNGNDLYIAEANGNKISNNENINIQNLSKGLYLLKVESGNTRKFIKK
jgi:hypothetical protein